jgi:hypothetical protein
VREHLRGVCAAIHNPYRVIYGLFQRAERGNLCRIDPED